MTNSNVKNNTTKHASMHFTDDDDDSSTVGIISINNNLN